MATVDMSNTRNNVDSNGAPINPKNGLPIFDAASICLAGKITDHIGDHIGGFAQFTYSNYDHQNGDGKWQRRWGSDNTDLCVGCVVVKRVSHRHAAWPAIT